MADIGFDTRKRRQASRAKKRKGARAESADHQSSPGPGPDPPVDLSVECARLTIRVEVLRTARSSSLRHHGERRRQHGDGR